MEKNERQKRLDSWIVAVFLAESNICTAINTFITIPYISVVLMLGLILTIVFSRGFKLSFNLKCAYMYLLIGGVLLVSMVFNGVNSIGKYLTYYFIFGFTALLIVSLKLDYKKVFLNIIKLYFVILLVYFIKQRESFLSSDKYWTLQMGIAYSMIIPFLFSFAFIIYNRKQFSEIKKFYFLIAVIEFVSSAYIILFDCATRGAIITLVIGIILILIGNFNKDKKLFLIICCVIVGIVVFIYKDSILAWMNSSFFYNDIPSLKKSDYLSIQGNTDNGRTDYYNDAIMYFYNSPIIGNGVGFFEKYHEGAYVHGIFLELLCEYGLLGMIVMIPLITRFGIRMVKTTGNIRKLFIIILIAISSVLLFSNSYWLLPSFWFILFVILSYKEKEYNFYD